MSSLFLCEAYTTRETTGGHQDVIDNLQGQRRQPPGGWSRDDPGTVLGVEFRIVTWAFQRLYFSLPQPHITSFMRTDRRVRHDPLWGACPGSLGEFRWVEADEEHLVEPRPIPYYPCVRVDGVGGHRRTT